MRTTHLVLSITTGLLLCAVAAGAQPVTFSTPRPSLQLRAGAPEAIAELLVQASGPGVVGRSDTPVIVDVPVQRSPIVVTTASRWQLKAKKTTGPRGVIASR
jgi:hypothetical protein